MKMGTNTSRVRFPDGAHDYGRPVALRSANLTGGEQAQ
jgi:hypothetical protein